ncbi:NAP-domain-containing protein [Lactarius akahatsu]|uniref:NAP-domain-containing protein n=1 Tax=Lactarius akahatsu TaxID=416441 RepID=A0AAD4LCT5_9AGAM|nr:NAP-domain-containing protein [Lactarius akahatsu]
MSSHVPINQHSDITAPTPQNTPLTHAPITAGLPRPTVPDISEDAEPAEDSTAVHEAMLGLVQGRLAGLLGKSSGYIESLSDGTKTSIVALIGVQVKQNELQNQYKRECLELEKKYLELTKPLYERRRALIYTAAVPTPEELDAGAAQAAKDNPEENPFLVTPVHGPLPPNHVGLSELITDRDAGALKNSKKTYVYREEVGYSGDFVYDRAIGTEIKHTNRTRLVRKAHPTESFFNFFSPPVAPSEEAIEEGDIGEEELDELEEKLEIDYQIGEDIKEKIIPRAVRLLYRQGNLSTICLSDDEDDYEDEGRGTMDSDEDDPPAPRRSAGGGRGGRGGLTCKT